MKRIVSVLFMLLFISSLLVSQPKIAVAGGMSFDFGAINSTMTARKLLTIRNGGTDTLRITDVSGSCGCTGTMLSNQTLAPHDSGTLAITFDPRKFSGKVEKAISMNTNDPANPRPHITFTATVTKRIEISPDYIIFRTSVNTPSKESITFTNATTNPIKIVSVVSTSKLIAFEPAVKELRPGAPLEVICTFTPTESGAQNGDITFTTDDPAIPFINLRFFALVKEAVPAASSGKGQ